MTAETIVGTVTRNDKNLNIVYGRDEAGDPFVFSPNTTPTYKGESVVELGLTKGAKVRVVISDKSRATSFELLEAAPEGII